MASKKTEQLPEKAFHIVDEKKGLFKLWDHAFGCFREWKISDDISPGVLILDEKIGSESDRISEMLPDNLHTLSKDEKKDAYRKALEKLSDDEKQTYLRRVKENSDKRLTIMCMYLDPSDDIPEPWTTKVEFLASCITHELDSMKIHNFFLKHYNAITK